MKKLILATFLLISITSNAQSDTLKLASDIWPPFTNIEGQKRIAIDIVNVALNRISIDHNMIIDEFDDVMLGISEGFYSGSSALWFSDERAENLLFSDPYLHNQLILVGRKGSDVNAENFSELGEVKIGVVENYAYGDELLNTAAIEIIKGVSDQKNLERLLSKKVDYILVDALLLEYLMKYQTNDVSQFLEVGSTPMSIKALHFAINKNIVDAENIIASFNKEIVKMIADGTYHEILDLNWIETDINGDGKLELVLIGDKAGENAPSTAYSIDPANKNISSEGFYINGEFYLNWDQVPANLKVSMTETENSNYHDGGIILTF